MTVKDGIHGQRPRPRVAVLGSFKDEVLEKFKHLFPTVWIASNFPVLFSMVDGRELDLIIIGKNIQREDIPLWNKHTNVICFSKSHDVILPGPYEGDWIKIEKIVATEQFLFQDLPLALHRRREFDLKDVNSVKGWPILGIEFSGNTSAEQDGKAKKLFLESSIVIDPYSKLPFAVIFMRQKINLGVAWLPNDIFDEVAWVELIVTEWSKIDPSKFPNFGDWTKSKEWLTKTEIDIIKDIKELEERKILVKNEIDKEIILKASLLAEATISANKGRRRLLTAQGNELVEEVKIFFQRTGFRVASMDEIIPEGTPKKEDLRIITELPSGYNWEAIVEIRGYARSGGTTADISRLGRFALFYQSEKGKMPDKIIYVVNGQIELNPSQRQPPLISSPEDVKEFSEQNGLLMSTIDIYNASNTMDAENDMDIRSSITDKAGRWNTLLVREPA